jgi:hypothetical protein
LPARRIRSSNKLWSFSEIWKIIYRYFKKFYVISRSYIFCIQISSLRLRVDYKRIKS